MAEELTGGCQCGAVRFRLKSAPTNPHICHCRMCQKAFGSYFAPLAGVPEADLVWTHGGPKRYRSSLAAERGFCAACGTPLTFRYIDQPCVCVSLGSLDDPERVRPIRAYGLETRLSFFAALAELPATRTQDRLSAETLERCKPVAAPRETTPAGLRGDSA